MIDSKEEILFSSFYVAELFNEALKKGSRVISKAHFGPLKEVCEYLLKEKRFITGLEKLAQFQGTNEFAIFLFDMMERIADYSPVMIYATFPELSDDFINLYQLMTEDKASIDALHSVIEQFHEADPQYKVHSELVREMAFTDFYHSHAIARFKTRVEELCISEQSQFYSDLVNILLKNTESPETLDPGIADLLKFTRKVMIDGVSAKSPVKAMKSLNRQLDNLIQKISKYEDDNPDVFTSILTGETLPKRKAAPALVREEIPEKPVTIDNLLFDYFSSEISDHIAMIKENLESAATDPDSRSVLPPALKQFRSLKEISMIHGYSGIEYFCSMLIRSLETLLRQGALLGPETMSGFDRIFEEITNVSQFADRSRNKEQMALIERLNAELTASFLPAPKEKIVQPDPEIPAIEAVAAGPEAAKVPEETAEEARSVQFKPEAEIIAPEPVVAAPEVITPPPEPVAIPEQMKSSVSQIIPGPEEAGFSDSEIIIGLLREVLQKAHRQIIASREADADIAQLLSSIQRSTAFVIPRLSEGFFTPLRRAYQILPTLNADEKETATDIINAVWQEALLKLDEENMPAQAQAALIPVFALEAREELFGFSDGPVIAETLADAQIIRWQSLKNTLIHACVENDVIAKQQALEYLSCVMDLLMMTEFDSYRVSIQNFEQLLRNDKAVAFTRELAEEIYQTMLLILDRIKTQGRSGNAEDIVEALAEILNEALSTAKAPQVPAAAEDMEQVFVAEAEDQIAQARRAVIILRSNPNDRKKFIEIENSVHAIRSSAFLLKKQEIGDLAVTLEEVAELFGSSALELPAMLLQRLQEGLDALEELLRNAGADVKPATDALQEILDKIVMEQPAAAPESPEEEAVEMKAAAVAETEKPLFSEQETIDQDLLDIFFQESAGFMETLQKANAAMLEDLNDKAALQDFEYAAHSLKSAAKMLGFREIGQFIDSLEEIIEAIQDGEITNTTEIQQNIGQGLEVVKRLTSGEPVPSSELSLGLNLLDIRHLRMETQKSPAEATTGETREDVKEAFLTEAAELIHKINNCLIELEKLPESASLLTELLRNMHTLKGSSMMLKYEKIGGLAHKLEDYLHFYREQSSEIKQAMINPAFSAIDLIQEMVEAIRNGKAENATQITAKIAEIDNRLYQLQNIEPITGLPETKIPSPKRIKETAAKPLQDEGNIIRINTAYLDNLINMATELLVNRTELTTNFDDLKKIYSALDANKKLLHLTDDFIDEIVDHHDFEQAGVTSEHPAANGSEKTVKTGESLKNVAKNISEIETAISRTSSELNKLSQRLEKNILRIANLSKSLHTDILKARMVPIENLFSRFPRAVRDLAKAQGKKINLLMEGNDTEMDRAMVEALAEPMLHTIRNAVDHGIESPEERRQQNKDVTGTILLRARQDKGQIVIEISDDGRGIDINRVKEKILAGELATPEAVNAMSEAEILDFIFYSGFSTRDTATDLSGRGIGLDIVANQIQKMKGIVRIRTEKSAGTTFSIRLPLTLVISQALMTRTYGQNIAVPLIAIQESIEVKKENILIDDLRKYIQVRGKILPYITIDEILHFHISEEETGGYAYALVLHDAGISIAFGIREITGRHEIVIKSLGSALQNVEYIAGGAILGNGEVALILDYAAVIRMAEMQYFGAVSEARSGKRMRASVQENDAADPVIQHMTPVTQRPIPRKTIRDRKPRILIVDDSSSVRIFVSSVLEKHGFSTLKASDGNLAVKTVFNEVVDLIITDLEMPVMHGFELISKVRSESRFNDIPIVILTGRTGQPQREKGEALGANAFIGKPFKEGDLLSMVETFIDLRFK
jgi:chemotaxis protein histidine kinase CheA